jgi:hypothetical protein
MSLLPLFLPDVGLTRPSGGGWLELVLAIATSLLRQPKLPYHRCPPLDVLIPAKFEAPSMWAMRRRRQTLWRHVWLFQLQHRLVSALLLQVLVWKPMRVGSMLVEGAAPPGLLCQSRQGKVSSVASPSSVGLEEGASVVSNVVIGSAHVVSLLDVFAVVALVIGRGSVMLAFQLLAPALRSLALGLQ